MWLRGLHLLSPLSKKDDLSAVGTLRQMSKGLQMLVIRQDVLCKGAELVCVWMLAGMEKFAHDV
jgi:hypothetical protein